MKKFVCSLTILFFAFQFSYSQTTLKGTVIDTSEKKNLSNSVVSILRKTDSVLIAFTRSDGQGKFQITAVKPGTYLLMVTHPTYADFMDDLQLLDSVATDIGQIMLIQKSQLLQEVIIKQQLGAIRFRKDTIEYVADSFKVQANANVEELLKKLPGLTVNKKGEITAQGEKVEKVLVDGEEFFGDDPTIATQNIRADAVDKVQVLDKKSDQAEFTGIDDGKKTKTINLKLKEDKKNGYFGKVSVAGGLKDNYSNEAMINLFKGKRKIAAFGTMSNTGKTGLNWSDQQNYGGNNMNTEMDEGSGMIFFYSGDDFDGGNFNGEGVPKSWAAGGHFSNKWNSDKNNFNGSIRYNKVNVKTGGSTLTQFILPDTLYYNNERRNSFSQKIRNRANGSYELQIDSFSSVKITMNGGMSMSQGINNFFSEALTSTGQPVNRSNRTTTTDGNNNDLNSSLLYKKRFRKKGRTISLNLSQKYTFNDSEGMLNAINEFYTKNSLFLTDTIDQKKVVENRMFSGSSKISYTEPLSKSIFLELNYLLGTNNSASLRRTFEENGSGKYEALIDSLSNEFDYHILTNNGGFNLRVNKKKYNFSVGGNVSGSRFRQTDVIKDTSLTYNYVNLFPRGSFNYTFTQQRRISINYDGNTRQPSIEQIQPVRENSDPLNIRLGNPDLRQEFNHTLRVFFYDYKVFNERNIWVSFYGTKTDNAISSKDFIDTLGRKVYQAINKDGNYNLSLYADYGFKIKKLNLRLSGGINARVSRYNNIVNGIDNVNDNKNIGFRLGASYSKEKKIDISLNSSPTYSETKSSIRKDVVTKYWQFEHNIDLTWQLPKKIEFKTDCEFIQRQRTAVFADNNNVIKWNASIGKKILKNETGLVKFGIYDILNQNIGFSRDITNNYISERRYNTLMRYWLLTFTWNFAKNGKAPTSMFGD
ncbi:MAG TPA: TonB-dependent receptor [Flavitalea sp.]|nr:TonB-dependent receptor [Flavitalea sp.]